MSELDKLSIVDIPSGKVFVKIRFPFKKISDKQRVVAGYANIEQIDRQNELIPVEVLKEAWDRLFKGQVRIHLMHTSIPVGEPIDEFTEEDGTHHKTGMDGVGLYVVSKVWDNTNKANETWDLIEKKILKAYSIGGEALRKSEVCNGRICHKQIDKMDFHEISYVDKEANQGSIFRILKRDEAKTEVDLPNIIHITKELLQKPIPKPRPNESQDKYIPRCASVLADADPEMPNKQRVAICFNTFREARKSGMTGLSDLLLFTNPKFYQKILKQDIPVEELYDVFLVRKQVKQDKCENCEKCKVNKEEAKNLEFSVGAVQSDDDVNARQQEVDSAVAPSYNAESKTKKIKIKVKLHGENN